MISYLTPNNRGDAVPVEDGAVATDRVTEGVGFFLFFVFVISSSVCLSVPSVFVFIQSVLCVPTVIRPRVSRLTLWCWVSIPLIYLLLGGIFRDLRDGTVPSLAFQTSVCTVGSRVMFLSRPTSVGFYSVSTLRCVSFVAPPV